MIISRSIHVTANGIIAFFFMTEYYSIVYLYHTEVVFLFGKTQDSGAFAMGSKVYTNTANLAPSPGRRWEEQQLKVMRGLLGSALTLEYYKLLL